MSVFMCITGGVLIIGLYVYMCIYTVGSAIESIDKCSDCYHTAQHFGEFGTARKLVEKILAADHTNNSSLLELTTFGG